MLLAPYVLLAQNAQPLTLAQALRMARTHNGDVTAEHYNVSASRAAVQQARGAFFPTVTPRFSYSDEKNLVRTGFPTGAFNTSGSTSDVLAKWQILDAGQREFGLLASRRSLQGEQANFRQTLRQTLFAVDQQYFVTLRDQQLEKVALAQAQRTEGILRQTEAQVQVGDAPRKDILQARADYLNARVQQLTAQNNTTAAQATLKSTIGWELNQTLPPLEEQKEPTVVQPQPSLAATFDEGLKKRPDLQALRYRAESLRFNALSAERESGITWSLDAQYQTAFSPNVFQDRLVSFGVSYPLFDGGTLQARARQLRFEEKAQLSSIVQREREARAEIETAYLTLQQNIERVSAAKAAVEAARQNYEAESQAQKLGAQNSTVITVLTAEVSLVTAESNYIQAIYDYYISQAQLDLATGRPVLGEAP